MSYNELLMALQVRRNQFEQKSHRLMGATDVRASMYPHQLGVVSAVLTAPVIRHVLCDEVGMGKTLETIMIIQSRLQADPNMRVGILVPKHLEEQWKNELLSRMNSKRISLNEDDNPATNQCSSCQGRYGTFKRILDCRIISRDH